MKLFKRVLVEMFVISSVVAFVGTVVLNLNSKP